VLHFLKFEIIITSVASVAYSKGRN